MSSINKLSAKTLRRAAMRTSAVSLATLLGVACGASEDDGIDTAALTESVPCEPTDAGTDEPDGDTDEPGEEGPSEPGSPFFASVKANGTGCPSGTWETVTTDDGKSYSLRFKSYAAALEGESRISFKDCNLTIALKAPEGLSYAVQDFSYYGHVKLAEGVRGFATANYYFQGSPAASADKETRVDFTGPIDQPLVLHRSSAEDGLTWSPCDLERNLQVVTRVGVQKDSGVTGTGKVGVDGLGNPDDLGLSFKLAWRKCSDNSRVEGPAPAPSKPQGTPVGSGPLPESNGKGETSASTSDTSKTDTGKTSTGTASTGKTSTGRTPGRRWPWGN